MSDPVRSTPSDGGMLDVELLYLIGDTQYPDVRLDDSRPSVEDQPQDALDLACHGLEAATPFIVAHELKEALTLGARANFPGVTVPLDLVCGAAESFRQGRVEGEQHTYDRLRGALAVLEGRDHTRSVIRESVHNRSYGDGMRAARAHAGEPEFLDAQRIVAERRDDGYAAVVFGRDHGPGFEARYHDDLPFHHAVDHARQQRAAGSAEWQSIETRRRADERHRS